MCWIKLKWNFILESAAQGLKSLIALVPEDSVVLVPNKFSFSETWWLELILRAEIQLHVYKCDFNGENACVYNIQARVHAHK